MITNEELVGLYLSTEDEKNKNIIFNKIYEALKNGAMKICHYYTNTLSECHRSDFFEEAMQESRLCLLKCIKNFSVEKNNHFITFYYKCLKNHIYNMRHEKFTEIVNEVTDDTVLNWSNGVDESDNEGVIDRSILRIIFEKNIECINFIKPIHKKIFIDYIGFGEDKNIDESFASLGRKYLLSRMAIKKICDRYFLELKDVLEQSGDIDKIRLFK